MSQLFIIINCVLFGQCGYKNESTAGADASVKAQRHLVSVATYRVQIFVEWLESPKKRCSRLYVEITPTGHKLCM